MCVCVFRLFLVWLKASPHLCLPQRSLSSPLSCFINSSPLLLPLLLSSTSRLHLPYRYTSPITFSSSTARKPSWLTDFAPDFCCWIGNSSCLRSPFAHLPPQHGRTDELWVPFMSSWHHRHPFSCQQYHHHHRLLLRSPKNFCWPNSGTLPCPFSPSPENQPLLESSQRTISPTTSS